MLTDRELSDAGSYVESLRIALHDRTVPGNYRARAAASCFAIVQDHHHAIVVLLQKRLYASCFALVRSAFEAYVRGEWLANCANDDQVEGFWRGQKLPKIDRLLSALEKTDAFKERILSRIKERTWKAMCAYTHTGGLHVQRWNTEGGIEPNYSDDEVREVLQFAERFASLSVLGVAALMQDEALARAVSEKFKAADAAD